MNVSCERRLLATAVLACAFSSLAPGSAGAEAPAAPVQLALVNPVQLIEEQRSVAMLRLSLLMGANLDVTGLDLSALGTRTDGTLRGLQIAAANEVDGDCVGVQLGVFVNHVGGELSGLQLGGLMVQTEAGKGAQLALLLAQAEEFNGFQLGLFTYAEDMKGLQIGLFNVNKNGFLPIFPIFNYGR